MISADGALTDPFLYVIALGMYTEITVFSEYARV
jgi:hypothetical protein